jgi:PTH1 family peptidyl-tRNA hydrolase
MNRSGAILAPLHASAPIDPGSNLLVLVDEAALPAGTFRIRAAGSAGGHNGLKDLEETLGTREYARLRIGVGPVPPGADLAEFVLEPPGAEDRTAINALLEPMAEAVESWMTDGVEAAMNRFNRRPTES